MLKNIMSSSKTTPTLTDKGERMKDRFKFYDEAKEAYAIIATSEKAIYANVMLQKGVI